MNSPVRDRGFQPQDNLISILPSIVAGIILLLITAATILYNYPSKNLINTVLVILYTIAGCLYLIFYYFLFTSSPNQNRFSWINAVISGFALGGFSALMPEQIDHMLYMLVFIAAMSSSLMSTRGSSYFIVLSSTFMHFIFHLVNQVPSSKWIIHFGLSLAALMAIETIQQLKNIARAQISRHEIINELSKQIISTLDTTTIISLLDKAFQNAIAADSYYIGFMEGDTIHLRIFFDSGEYFNDIRIERSSSLSNWVIANQKELFIPDLRKDIGIDNVELNVIGKNRLSLSWMGVPLRGQHVNGVMSIASYRANAFDRSDMELLSSIAQRAALALDNSHHHAQVEEQARQDSLTKVFNHGYFIQALGEQAQACLAENEPLSLIMLDIDFFKLYNDAYGHLVGDEVLISLSDVIRSHIKNTDAIGRWGGEEFAISLPHTDGAQAAVVAERIRQSMASLTMHDGNQAAIPAPTVSQGIAVFPSETNEITKLIDLADNRLYTAKKRGRDQVEPASAFWENKESKVLP